MRDLYHNVKVTQALSPVVATTTQTSTAIDLQGYGSASVCFAVGQSGDALSGSLYWTLKLQHSDDGVAYSDVTAGELLGGAASVVIDSPSLDETAYHFGYAGGKRYIRAVATPSGTHASGTPIAAIALLGTPSYSPVS